jgi:hypothetical protein
MTCQTVQLSLSAHLDGDLPEEESRRVMLHLARCRGCSLASEQHVQVRRALRNLPVLAPPEDLSARLYVMASRERARRLSKSSPAAAWRHYGDRIWLCMDNLMRPLALPFAGGLVSALLLFCMLVPNILMHRYPSTHDVPTGLYTEAAVKSISPFGFNDDDFVVEVIVDGQGRMVDYSIAAHGQHLTNDLELRRSIENNLLFTEFTPATAFGQPTFSRIFLSFYRSHINVKS